MLGDLRAAGGAAVRLDGWLPLLGTIPPANGSLR
jgi:hypothetical protein